MPPREVRNVGTLNSCIQDDSVNPVPKTPGDRGSIHDYFLPHLPLFRRETGPDFGKKIEIWIGRSIRCLGHFCGIGPSIRHIGFSKIKIQEKI